MGFGYNPDLTRLGERLDIFSFFSWMSKIQESFFSDWVVYDASAYFIVNRTPRKKIVKLGDNPKGQDILEVLVDEQQRPKRSEIWDNCELRSKYLQELIGISGIEAEYVDSRVVFRKDEDYVKSLDIALEFVERLKVEDPRLVARIVPNNGNPASALYLPLEIAEAVYLRQRGVLGKFGPVTEEFFDSAIVECFGDISYSTVRCGIGNRKPGYLSDRNVIWARTPDQYIRETLSEESEYSFFVRNYLDSFVKDGESFVDCAIRLKKLLKEVRE